jgi:flagellar L-ring protein precursor FlgH
MLNNSRPDSRNGPDQVARPKLLIGTTLVVWGVVLVLALAPAPSHARKIPEGFAPALPPTAVPPPAIADGAIFHVGTGYAALVEGSRARHVGDPITVLLVESTSTSKTAGTKTQKAGDFSVTPPSAGPLSFINPNALKASGGSSFNGTGNTTQTSSLSGSVAVTIAEVRANGTVLVKGEKRLLLSQGQEWVQFSGIVRLADLDEQSRISSAQIADARIEYTGNGAINRAAKEGWLSKFFNIVSPF